MKSNFQIFHLNEFAITITIGNEINLEILEKAFFLKEKIESSKWPWLCEVVSSYSSVSVFVTKEFYIENSSLEFFFRTFCDNLNSIEKSFTFTQNVIEIPVKYDGLDMELVTNLTLLSKDEIIAIHSKPIYTVALIGFLPGFPYLLGMDERLFVPRRENPRKLVEKGSVALAGNQTGIYPMDSPGGWQIIGKTEISMFSINDLSYLKIGDKVKFLPII